MPCWRRPDRGGDHLPAGEEPAVAVRCRRRQGRPVRCVRAGGHAAHGPGAAAAAGPRYARDHLAADGGTGPPGPGAAPRGGLQPAARPPGRRIPRRNPLFHDLDSPISLAFLARFGSQDAAAGLDEQAIGAWLATIAVRGRPAPASVLCARLHAAPPGAAGAGGAAQAGVTAALTATLTALSAQIKALETQIAGAAGRPPRRAHLHLAAPARNRARRPAARRDRRLPVPLPRP